MSQDIMLRRKEAEEVGIQDDPVLWAIFKEQVEQHRSLAGHGGGGDWDAPLDLRVMRPGATNLRKFWALTKKPVPASIDAILGPNIPILLNHVVTPFAADGVSPGKVWGLGYEFIVDIANANTISVLPNDEVLKIAEVGQNVELGLDIGGRVGIPDSALEILKKVPPVSLTGATLEASMSQKYQMSLHMKISLRKVVGAPVGAGGALWKMYRQDEPLDRPHTLLQTIVVDAGTKSIKCKIRTWAKQAGWLGTGLGAKYWEYEDKDFKISLKGLSV